MSNSKMSTQNIPNLHVCSTDKSKSKRIDADESGSKSVNANACSMEESESKSVHKMDLSVNTSEVKYTKDEEPSITDSLLIKAPGYLKLFECDKEFFKNLDATHECACTANAKDKYWAEMYDTLTN